jgi:adenine-specific DNA-methyltransferase
MARDGSSSTKILRHLERHLVGRDLDPVLCRLSVFFLRMFLYKDIVSAKFEPRFDIHTGNALRCFKRRYGRFNVVICNPPYRKMTSAEVTCVGSSYNEILGGQPNLYSLFFALALRLVRPCGVTAMLTPTSYLSGQSFAKLRAHVLSKAEAVQLDIIDDRNGVFVGVEQETAVAILRRKTQSESGLGATTIFVASREGTFKRAGRCILPISGTVWAIPRSIEDAATLKAVNGSKHSLVDYGYAPRVGAFVWNRDPRKRFSNWQDARRKALAPYPLIWSSHIGQDGRFVDQPKQAKARQFRFVDVGNVRQRPIVSGPCVALQRVTSNDQRKRLVAAAVPQSLVARCGGIVGENHVVFLEQINGHARLTPKQLVRMLRSPTIDQLFRCISGAVNVSVFELLRLPLPDPSVFPPLLRQGISPEKAVRLAFEAGRLRRRGRTRECAS